MSARCEATVSDNGPIDRAQHLAIREFSNQVSTRSPSRNRHSSTRIIAATAVTGLVIEASRKIVSRAIGTLL